MFHKVLNMPWVLNMLGFPRYQSSEYTRILNMLLVLNMTGLWICQNSGYARALNMWGWHRVLKFTEYAGISVNLLQCDEMVFVLHSLIVIPCLLEWVINYFNFNTKLEVIVWRKMRLFSWRDRIWCFLVAGIIWFVLF